MQGIQISLCFMCIGVLKAVEMNYGFVCWAASGRCVFIPACQEIEWVDGILIRAGAKIERQIYGFYIRPWTERDVPSHRHRPDTLYTRLSPYQSAEDHTNKQTHTHTDMHSDSTIYQALTTRIEHCRTARFLFIFVRCLHRVIVKGSEL